MSTLRRRFMVSAPNKVVIDNIIKCSYTVMMEQYEEYGGALILGTEFDLSQVEWIAVYVDGELFREFEPASVIDISSGIWNDVRIKVNSLTECSYMFCETGLRSADFSTVDTGNITNCTSMFESTRIRVSPFDVLPIKNLSNFCCKDMFYGCSGLTTAPELPATKLTTGCYERMFFGCISLNYIKMLATDISAVGCLSSWVYNVASTGTFVKSKDATWDVTGSSGVPEGWTVITDDQESGGDSMFPATIVYSYLEENTNNADIVMYLLEKYPDMSTSDSTYTPISEQIEIVGSEHCDGIVVGVSKWLNTAVLLFTEQSFANYYGLRVIGHGDISGLPAGQTRDWFTD